MTQAQIFFKHALGDVLFEKKLYFEAMLVYSRIPELKSKMGLTASKIDRLLSILESKHKETSILWNKNPLKDFVKAQKSTENDLTLKWVKCAGIFAIETYENHKEYPDLLGECYNNVCEYLIGAIENNDFDSFEIGYKGFLGIVVLYQEFVRQDIKEIKETHLQQIVLNVFSAPMIEYSMISGYAYLWGEITHDDRWKNLITSFVEETYKSKGVNAINFFEQWISIVSIKKGLSPAIYNRSLIHTNWDSRISHAFAASNLMQYKNTLYGYTKLETDNALLKAFCGNMIDFMLSNGAEELYLIMCINKYVSVEKRFIGTRNWEKGLELDENV